MAGVVVGISRPDEPIIRNLVPFFACDLAGFATDANTRVGEEADLDVILHVGMLPLIRALDSFADHTIGVMEQCSDGVLRDLFMFSSLLLQTLHPADSVFPCCPWSVLNLSPAGALGGGCSGCKLGGPPRGTYLSSHSSNAGPRGNRPGTMRQASPLVSMIVTFGSPEMASRSLAASPRTGPAEPK